MSNNIKNIIYQDISDRNINVYIQKVCKLSNETDFLLTKVFIFFKHQCYPLQNSSLGQLHTDGDVVLTLASSAISL
jgi:hypothetical protein